MKTEKELYLPPSLPRGSEVLPLTPSHTRPAHKSGAPSTWWPPASATARALRASWAGKVRDHHTNSAITSLPIQENPQRGKGHMSSMLPLSQLPSASLWSCSRGRCGIYLLGQSACFRAKAKAYWAWERLTINVSLTDRSQMSSPNRCMALNIAGSSSAALLSMRPRAIGLGTCSHLGKGSKAGFLRALMQRKVESEHMAALWIVTVQNEKE